MKKNKVYEVELNKEEANEYKELEQSYFLLKELRLPNKEELQLSKINEFCGTSDSLFQHLLPTVQQKLNQNEKLLIISTYANAAIKMKEKYDELDTNNPSYVITTYTKVKEGVAIIGEYLKADTAVLFTTPSILHFNYGQRYNTTELIYADFISNVGMSAITSQILADKVRYITIKNTIQEKLIYRYFDTFKQD